MAAGGLSAFGLVLIGLNVPVWVVLPISFVGLILIVRFVGKPVAAVEADK